MASLAITLWLLGLPYGRYPNTDFLIRAYVNVSKVPLGISYFTGAAICFNSCQLTGVCHEGPLSCSDISRWHSVETTSELTAFHCAS